jgi:hypothetical protein
LVILLWKVAWKGWLTKFFMFDSLINKFSINFISSSVCIGSSIVKSSESRKNGVIFQKSIFSIMCRYVIAGSILDCTTKKQFFFFSISLFFLKQTHIFNQAFYKASTPRIRLQNNWRSCQKHSKTKKVFNKLPT